MTLPPTNSPIDDLEQRARADRAVLHQRATELKTKVEHVRENLDIHSNARRHFGAAAAILAGIGLLSGYALAGLFTEH
jgi:hypothetical protein